MKKYKVIASGYLEGLGSVTEGSTVELEVETGSLFKERGFLRELDPKKDAKTELKEEASVKES